MIFENTMKKRVFILGVNGFLGRALWKYLKLKRARWDVYGLDLKAELKGRNIYVVDLNNKQKFKSKLNLIRPDYIFHCAGGRMADKNKLYASNFMTTKHVFDAIRTIHDYYPRYGQLFQHSFF